MTERYSPRQDAIVDENGWVRWVGEDSNPSTRTSSNMPIIKAVLRLEKKVAALDARIRYIEGFINGATKR